jgi:tetratricopeptide (TPR) repeat protein
MRRPLLVLLLALAPLLGATGSQAGSTATPDQVVELLSQLRVEEAETELAAIPQDAPGRSMTAAAVHFYRGRYPEAAEALRQGDDTPKELRARLDWLPERISEAWSAVEGMEERVEGNFVFRYEPGPDAILVDYAIETLEAQRIAMKGLLGVVPTHPIVVEFLPDVDGLVAATGLPQEWVETTGTVAVSKWDRLMVLSPMNMARGYPWLDTLAHEYVHLALSRASHDQAPVWFQEGSAKVLESAWRGRDERFIGPHAETLLAKALGDDALIPFDAMHPSMAALPSADDAQLAFAQVAFAIDYIFEQSGDEGYRRIVEQTRLHGDVLRGVDLVLGASGGRFERRVERHLGKQGLQARTNIASFEPAIHAGAAGEVDEQAQELDPVLQADRQMQDFTRIGDLLRLRGHVEAAVLEYRKAEQVGVFHSPALANKHARALRALDRTEEARRLLRTSVELYPEYTPTVALLADLAAEAGDDRTALQMGRRGIALNPFDPQVHRQLATVLERTGDAAGAEHERAVLEHLARTLGRSR